jgi:hypothetical protein
MMMRISMLRCWQRMVVQRMVVQLVAVQLLVQAVAVQQGVPLSCWTTEQHEGLGYYSSSR